MKRALFLFLSKMDYGGQERFVSRLTEILQNDYEIFVVLFDASVINYEIHGHVLDLHQEEFGHNLVDKVRETTKNLRALRRCLKMYKPVACISFGTGPNLLNLLAKKKSTLVIPSIRGFATAEKMVVRRLDRWLYQRADAILCVSEGIKKKIETDLPSVRDKLVVIYNAYNCDQIIKEAGKLNREAKNLQSEPRIVSVGTLRPEKGYWHLIKAVYILKEKHPAIKLTIVGSDEGQNGKNLKSLIRLLQIENHVYFEGWQRNPYTYMAKADVYVLSSVREGFPNALVEAMACGKAIVADDCLTGPREILSSGDLAEEITEITNAEFGILTPQLSVEEDYSDNIPEEDRLLAKAIDIVLSDNQLRVGYENKALIRAREFSYATCRSKVKKVINITNE